MVLSLLTAISVPSGASTCSHSREQHVDLVHMLLERRVAGGIVGNVVGGAQSFTRVQGNIATGAAWFCGAPAPDRRVPVQQRRAVDDRPVIVLGGGKKQFRQTLTAQRVEDEPRHHQCRDHRHRVDDPAQPLPSLAVRIEEYLLVGHRRSFSLQHFPNSQSMGGVVEVTVFSMIKPRGGSR